jgi:hypothetical protein
MMKTLLTPIGLCAVCFLTGCAHDSNTKTASQPVPAVVAGQNATFTATNSGTAPFYYQWHFNGNGTNSSGLIVTNQ